MNYYNENDPHAAAWLKELIAQNLIAPGEVDERSIEDVKPNELRPFRQCHFFAGIGGWSLALRLAGWPGDRPVWTGSCPCQFRSSAARGRNNAPDLWPHLRRLIAANRPRVVFGEQVAAAGDWFDGVCDDLEAVGYEVGAAILPAISVGKDHARARVYFVCHANGDGESVLPVHAETPRLPGARGQSSKEPRAHGVSTRVAVMRGAGNAIVPQVAAEVIRAVM